ncbi:DUF3426 domain-containing protein [Phenylobacterium sp.]|uniref:DUF3426 domain-containing protein n=1 Tax=Phenylobacterium sp. TaxID=1871053 RepID=UPI0039838134
MILTCPECATSYFVDDARIPAAGRTVKCANCGARWMAVQPEPESAPQPVADELVETALEVEVDDATPGIVPPAPEDFEIIAEPAPHRRVRPTTARARPKTEARNTAFVWIGMAAVVAAMIAAALVFRTEVVRLWPQTSAAFAGVGLPVNSLGLVIEAVRFEPTFQGGRPVLSVTGTIRNVRTTAIAAPPIRISLLDRAGKPLSAKIARPIEADIPGGAKRYFAVIIADPPSGAADLDVTFDTAAPAVPPAAAPAGPAPTEAEPLPAGTPHALPDHG